MRDLIVSVPNHCLSFYFTMQQSKKGRNAGMTSPTEKKRIRARLFFKHIPHIKFQAPISNGCKA